MNKKRIGKNVKARRKDLKMTQADLAERTNLSVIHISHIETGTANMSIDALLSICHALNTTPNDILLGQYLHPSIEDMIFKEPSSQLNYDDKILLQNIYRFMDERRKK